MTQIEDIIAKAWDAEDAAQMGEPSPWVIDAADLDPDWADGRRACARAAIAALDAAGFVIVPKEPSLEMLDAGFGALLDIDLNDAIPPSDLAPIYRALIEARPK